MTRSITPRERQVLDGLWAGKSAKEIAVDMGVSPHTVASFSGRLRQRFGARNVVQLVRCALERGVLSL